MRTGFCIISLTPGFNPVGRFTKRSTNCFNSF